MLTLVLVRRLCSKRWDISPGTTVLVRRLCIRPPTKRPWYLTPLDRFESWLEVKFPRAYKAQRKILDGGKRCFNDLKVYHRVSSDMKQGKALQEFTRGELEVYILTPTDIEKLVVIAIVIALPMTIFILAIAFAFFPRLLLTRHFWTIEQTEKFRSIVLEKRRVHHYGKIAELLTKEVQRLEGSTFDSMEFLKALRNPPLTLRELESHTRVMEKVNVESLANAYQFHLSRAHGLWTWGSTSAPRLRRHAEILTILDSKLRTEGVDSMSLRDLKQSLYIRQFDVVDLSDNAERQLLKDWLSLTKAWPSNSLVLHAPVLTQLHLIAQPKVS